MTLSKEYKNAKSAFVSGLVVAGIGNLVNIAGNVICLIEQNRYVNSHGSNGSVEELYQLNQEAKAQPGYKRGLYMEIGGFVGMLVGGGIAWYGGSKMKKIRNSTGDTIATFDLGVTPYGIGLAVAF